MDHKIKIPTFGHKHNLLSKNQSKVRTVGYGGGRVSVPSFISSPIRGGLKIVDENGHGGRGGSGRMDVHLHQDLQKYNFDKKLTLLKN